MVKTSLSLENEPCCSKACKKNTKSLNSKITEVTDKLFDAKNMIYHYKLGLTQVETRLAELRDGELKYCERIQILKFKVESSTDCIESLKKELEVIKNEKEGLESKLIGSPNDLQNKITFVTETGASDSTISSKPFIKFVKAADRPTEDKTDKVKTAKKPTVKYAELYRRTSKSSKRVKMLEKELKVRTSPTKVHKVDRGRSRPVMAWVSKKIILSQRCINVSQRHINNSQQSCDSYARMVPAAAEVKE
nr:hypothetical protein [Tanacetum cinerariifolium]